MSRDRVSKQILDVAVKARLLEEDRKCLKQSLEDKMDSLQKMTSELLNKDETMKLLRQENQSLKSDMKTLDNQLFLQSRAISRPPSYQWQQSGEDSSLELMEFEPRVDDKSDNTRYVEHLKRKIGRLQARLTELLNSNQKWNIMCHKLQCDLDEVQKELDLTTELLRQERKKNDQVEEEFRQHKEDTGQMLQHASDQIERLEEQVKELEKQKEDALDKLQQASSDSEMHQLEAETFKEDFKQEKLDHDRSKSNLASVAAQSSLLREELARKAGTLEKSKQEIQNMENENDALRQKIRKLLEEIEDIKCKQQMTESKTEEPMRQDCVVEMWQCGKCTYANPLVCSVCETPRSPASGVFSLARQQPLSETVREPYRPRSDNKPSKAMGDLEEDSAMRCFPKYQPLKRKMRRDENDSHSNFQWK